MVYLKEHKLAKGLSVPKLAELTGIPRRTLQEIENRHDCLVSNAEKLADALGITLNDLCSPPRSE